MPLGGDGDTPLAASYSHADPFGISGSSVARYIYDLSDWDNSRWIVPFGASGHPASPHFADQSSTWADVDFIPMTYSWDKIEGSAETSQTLSPGAIDANGNPLSVSLPRRGLTGVGKTDL